MSGIERFMGVDGRRKVITSGRDETLVEMARMLGRGGAKTIEWSWFSPLTQGDGDDAPAGVPVLWVCVVEWFDNGRKAMMGHAPAMTADHERGMVEATADVLRQLGANVTILQPVPDDPGDLS
jgi:hypothetical protein